MALAGIVTVFWGAIPAPVARGDQGEGLSVLETHSVKRAVNDALDWLARAQHEDGHWEAEEGGGNATTDIGVTGLCSLAFLEAGHLPGQGRDGDVVNGALRWLAAQAGREVPGLVGDRGGRSFMYNHALATLALCEARRRTGEPTLDATCRGALDFIARSRNPYKVWRYAYPPTGRDEDNDMSVTGWMLYALMAGKQAGFEVDDAALEAGRRFIDDMTDARTFRTGYNRKGGWSAREPGDEQRWPFEQVEAMTAVALGCRQVTAAGPITGQPAVRGGIALLAAKPPHWEGGRIDFYYWYAGTRALHALGVPAWKAWKRAVAEALVLHQELEGLHRGTWDPGVDPWGNMGGRFYSTALAVLTLQEVLGQRPDQSVVTAMPPAGVEQAAEPLSVGEAIGRGLDWLARHQHEAGYWGAASFQDECTAGACDGRGNPTCDVGATGLALLAFLSAEAPRGAGDHRLIVEKGLRWLQSNQGKEVDGLFGDRGGQYFMYNHSIAALVSCLARKKLPEAMSRKSAQKALDFIARARNPGKVWRYYYPPTGRDEDNDMSVTGWMLQALRAGREAKLGTDEAALEAGWRYITDMTDPQTWRTGYVRKGGWSAREPGDEVRWPYENFETMTALALLCRQELADLLDREPQLAEERSHRAALLARKLPRWEKGYVDYVYWYDGTLALRDAGGEAWAGWRAAVITALTANQRSDACARGSWNPQACPWGDVGGRVYSTAMAAATLAATSD